MRVSSGFMITLAFNRTIVELKFETGGAIIAEEKPFNRTIVELKYHYIEGTRHYAPLLIVP